MPLNAQRPGLLSGSHCRRTRGTRDGVRVGALEREAAEYAQEGIRGGREGGREGERGENGRNGSGGKGIMYG